MISKDSNGGEEIIEITFDPSDITIEHLCRIRYHDDAIAIALKSHLLVEYLVNRIVAYRLGNDPDKLTFSKKIKHIYTRGLIPDYIFQNVDKINRFRNRLVHKLNYNLAKDEMTIVNKYGEIKKLNTTKKRYPDRHYLKMLGHVCLLQLRNHMLVELKIEPRYLEKASLW